MYEDTVQKLLADWVAAAVAVKELGSINAASRTTGVPRKTIYDVLWALEEEGHAGLRALAERRARCNPQYTAAVHREVARVVRSNPTWGRRRIVRVLAQSGFTVSSTRVQRLLVQHRQHSHGRPQSATAPLHQGSRSER